MFSQELSRTNQSQTVVESASILAESNHQTDIYFYRWRDRQLYSPTGKCFIEAITSGEVNRSLVDNLQQWTEKNSSGLAVWVSPPLDKDHPSTKITLFEILSGSSYKMVKNTARLVDLSDNNLLYLSNLLATFTIDPTDYVSKTEDLRSKLFIVSDKNGVQDLIQQIANQPANWAEYKKLILLARRASDFNSFNYLERLIPYMGSYSLSCPLVRASPPTLAAKNETLHSGEKTLRCTCPSCHKEVEAKIADGKIHCPNCGQSATYRC